MQIFLSEIGHCADCVECLENYKAAEISAERAESMAQTPLRGTLGSCSVCGPATYAARVSGSGGVQWVR